MAQHRPMATIRDFEVHAEEEEDDEGDLGLERTHTLRKHTKVHRNSTFHQSMPAHRRNSGFNLAHSLRNIPDA